MTRVTRRVCRETAATIREAGRNRPIIVTLYPPGRVVGLRAKGRRKTYFMPIDKCYRLAVWAEVEATLTRGRSNRRRRAR